VRWEVVGGEECEVKMGKEWMKRSIKNSWGEKMDCSTRKGEIVKGVS
jgi:hypothetical protein